MIEKYQPIILFLDLFILTLNEVSFNWY